VFGCAVLVVFCLLSSVFCLLSSAFYLLSSVMFLSYCDAICVSCCLPTRHPHLIYMCFGSLIVCVHSLHHSQALPAAGKEKSIEYLTQCLDVVGVRAKTLSDIVNGYAAYVDAKAKELARIKAAQKADAAAAAGLTLPGATAAEKSGGRGAKESGCVAYLLLLLLHLLLLHLLLLHLLLLHLLMLHLLPPVRVQLTLVCDIGAVVCV
jgi:hypothetical protein